MHIGVLFDGGVGAEVGSGAFAFTMGDMEQIILNILEVLRRGEAVDDKTLVKLIHAEARREGAVGLGGMSTPIWSVSCCKC